MPAEALLNTNEKTKQSFDGSSPVKVVITMPAYNAAKTLEKTFEDIPHDLISQIIMVDDCSHDSTVSIGHALNLTVIKHPHNVGYGGNQKTGYLEALRSDADIVIMLHPDYQYDPKKIPELIEPILRGEADIVLISEIGLATRYFPEASSINFRRSVIYGLGVLNTLLKFSLSKCKLVSCDLFTS